MTSQVSDRPAAPGLDFVSADAGSSAQSGQLGLVMSRPSREMLVVAASGEIDMTTVDRVAEVLWPRLAAAVQVLVLDLGEVSFLGVAGMELLQQARLKAQARGLALRLVVTNHAVHRAVTMAGLDHHLPCYTTHTEALRGSPTQASTDV